MIVSSVILAAGQGTRMRSNLPKVLHSLAGKPFIEYSLRAVESLGGTVPVVVVGYGAGLVRQYVGKRAKFVTQAHQRGTAHALRMAETRLAGRADLVVVVHADMPLLTGPTLGRLVEIQESNPGPMTMLTLVSKDSHGFGRILRGPGGSVQAIVEEHDATPEQLAIDEVNAGVYCFASEWLWPALRRIKVSPKGEYYLTDTLALAVEDGLPVKAVQLEDPEEAIGINTRVHLAEAESILSRRINQRWMLEGVTIVDPGATYIAPDVKIGQDTIIHPGTHLQGDTQVGPECSLGPNAVIADSILGCACIVSSSILEGAVLEDHVEVGPYCHVGRGSHLTKGVILEPGMRVPASAALLEGKNRRA